MRGRTTFVIAHRLNTLRRADMVLVLDKGRVIQAGTHAQLMRQSGHYLEAARLQLAADPVEVAEVSPAALTFANSEKRDRHVA